MQGGSDRSRMLSHRAVHRFRVACTCVCLVAMAASTVPCNLGEAQQPMSNQAQPKQSIHDPSITRAPDANVQMEMREQAQKIASFEAANLERKRQLSEDSQALLKLATELKEELDKTPKDTLSLAVVHKAEEIEHLAHSVQLKMKLTVNARN